MEWKIGEIFENNGEWYQCVGGTCRNCSFYYDTVCKNITTIGSTNFGNCHCSLRTDHKSVIFKKLEEVGEPKIINGKKVQLLKSKYCKNCAFWDNNDCTFTTYPRTCMGGEYGVYVEIKQNKEDMEEKGQCCDNRFEIIAKAKEALLKETNIARDEQEMAVIDNILFRCWQMGWLDKYDDTKDSNSESIGKNLKPFSLEAAKAGKPVCTRDGRKARIICFDRRLFYKNVSYPILALVERSDGEDDVCCYNEKGKVLIEDGAEYKDDLMMLPEKKEGWVNVYTLNTCYSSKEEAEANIDQDYEHEYVRTVKIEWEE